MTTAARWALAYSSGDPLWRALSAPHLSDQPGDAGSLTAPEVQWTAWAGGTADTARVLVYVTAANRGGPVAVSYDCLLVRSGAGWLIVAVAP